MEVFKMILCICFSFAIGYLLADFINWKQNH